MYDVDPVDLKDLKDKMTKNTLFKIIEHLNSRKKLQPMQIIFYALFSLKKNIVLLPPKATFRWLTELLLLLQFQSLKKQTIRLSFWMYVSNFHYRDSLVW